MKGGNGCDESGYLWRWWTIWLIFFSHCDGAFFSARNNSFLSHQESKTLGAFWWIHSLVATDRAVIQIEPVSLWQVRSSSCSFIVVSDVGCAQRRNLWVGMKSGFPLTADRLMPMLSWTWTGSFQYGAMNCIRSPGPFCHCATNTYGSIEMHP